MHTNRLTQIYFPEITYHMCPAQADQLDAEIGGWEQSYWRLDGCHVLEPVCPDCLRQHCIQDNDGSYVYVPAPVDANTNANT